MTPNRELVERITAALADADKEVERADLLRECRRVLAGQKYPQPCGLCPGQIESDVDREWHGLGNCVPICEHCMGSGIADKLESSTPQVSEEQVKYMVNRFLSWRLPENFNPDAGISFKRDFNENTPWPMKHEPTGTNLFDATQTEAMIRYLIKGMSLASPEQPAKEESCNTAPSATNSAAMPATGSISSTSIKSAPTWRTVIVGLPIIHKLMEGKDVELPSLRVNLIPDDVLWNNRPEQPAAMLPPLRRGDEIFVKAKVHREYQDSVSVWITMTSGFEIEVLVNKDEKTLACRANPNGAGD